MRGLPRRQLPDRHRVDTRLCAGYPGNRHLTTTKYRLVRSRSCGNLRVATGYSEDYLGQRLFHFWRDEPRDVALRVFTSIVERGLLLSRATKELIDSFPYRRRDGKVERIEIVQNSRVCLTDIPVDKLSYPSKRYGRCAVGFSREQILAWGGLPVWYLPNHYHPGTMTDTAASFLYWIAEAVELMQLLPRLLEQTGSSLTRNGQPLPMSEAREKAESVKQSVHRLSSFLKEMSSKAEDDHEYLYEREWRIVGGAVSSEFGDPRRKLTEGERRELLAWRPEWGAPMEANDPRVTQQLTGEPLIESFGFFDGIPSQKTVSQAIEVILVPDVQFGDCVAAYIEDHPQRFRDGGPEVRVIS